MRLLLALGACWLLTTTPLARAQEPPRLRAGAATSNITPPLGGHIVGGFAPFPATHIHDELHARCLVLDDGKTKLALVVCDLLGIDRQRQRRGAAADPEGPAFRPTHVLISATHTHSAASALGKDARVISRARMDDYQRFVARRIADGVSGAVNLLRPGADRLGHGRGARARLQPPLAHEAGHDARQSVRRASTR